MSEIDAVQLVALLGWLILVGSALASRRLSWRKSLTMFLAWGAIFLGVFLVISMLITR